MAEVTEAMVAMEAREVVADDARRARTTEKTPTLWSLR